MSEFGDSNWEMNDIYKLLETLKKERGRTEAITRGLEVLYCFAEKEF